MIQTRKTWNIVLLGFPGSGKSTQAQLLSERLKLVHMDIGSALRKGASEDTLLGRQLDEIINRHKELVSDDIIGQVIAHELEGLAETQGFTLDGAPRRKSQIPIVEETLAQCGRKIDRVVFLELTEEESVRRIASRRFCAVCRRAWIIGKDIERMEDGCPVCGQVLQHRKDDTPDGVRKRLEVFKQETFPVIRYYRQIGKLLVVNARLAIEDSYADIERGLRESE